MRAAKLDGHIQRLLEGGTIRHIEKDGRMMIIVLTNGERWGIAMADPATGDGMPSEPILAWVNADTDDATLRIGRGAVIGMVRGGIAADGHLNNMLGGKVIESLRRDGRDLVVTTTDGMQFGIAFMDRGEPVNGEPCLVKVDVQIAVPGVTIAGMSAAL